MGKIKDSTIPDYDQHSHDPMCPQYDCWLEGCTVCDECALIARVREDERAKREADGPWFRSVVHECCERVQER